MMLYIYLGIVLMLIVAIVREQLSEKNIWNQIDAALVLVPLVLRLLLVK